MFTFIKKTFNEGAAGINVACPKCGKLTFVSTKATTVTITCKHCGKSFELSASNKECLRLMIAQESLLG